MVSSKTGENGAISGVSEVGRIMELSVMENSFWGLFRGL
jgi:hypothetical protein